MGKVCRRLETRQLGLRAGHRQVDAVRVSDGNRIIRRVASAGEEQIAPPTPPLPTFVDARNPKVPS